MRVMLDANVIVSGAIQSPLRHHLPLGAAGCRLSTFPSGGTPHVHRVLWVPETAS